MMNRLFLLGLCVLLASCAGMRNLAGKRLLKKQYLQSELFGSHFSGMVFKDLASGRVLLKVNDQHLLTPASNVKLLTYYVADKVMADSIPALRYCRTDDSLYFSGMGDPTFLHPDFADQRALWLLRSDSLIPVYCPSGFFDEKFGPGWAWDDYRYYFQPERSAFPMMGNSLWLKTDSLGQLNIFPDFFSVSLRWEPHTTGVVVAREEDRNVFSIGSIENERELDTAVPFIVSDSLVVRVLKSFVGDHVATGRFPGECERSVYFSQPKDSVFKRMLVESDNFVAEQLMVGASALLFDSMSVNGMIASALDNYFYDWKEEIRWKDGSGLSRYNQLSPAFLVWLLEKIYHENDWERLKTILPEGGNQGTLQNFLKSDTPYVYAKSGSMTGVYNLSGYLLTARGNLIAFSMMNNNVKAPLREVKAGIEKLLHYVHEHY